MNKVLLSIVTVLFLATSFYKSEVPANKPNIPLEKVPNKKAAAVKIKSTSDHALEVYSSLDFQNKNLLKEDVFNKAYLGFENLKKAGKLDAEAHLLTVCDFSLSSSQKRLWVIDLEKKTIVFNSLVAHGKNTGEEFAENFSNVESSLQSSMGFYVTETTYTGSNGYSLKLLGMDNGYNDLALQRAIVMHGAKYVSEDFIKNQKRLGRSWGCPAVPVELAEPIINTIKGKNCLFIYYPDKEYLANSQWLKEQSVAALD